MFISSENSGSPADPLAALYRRKFFENVTGKREIHAAGYNPRRL